MDERDMLRAEQEPPAAPTHVALQQANAPQRLKIVVTIGLELLVAIWAGVGALCGMAARACTGWNTAGACISTNAMAYTHAPGQECSGARGDVQLC
jgi:transposase